MTVREGIEEHCKEKGYDGLCRVGCCCFVGNLINCVVAGDVVDCDFGWKRTLEYGDIVILDDFASSDRAIRENNHKELWNKKIADFKKDVNDFIEANGYRKNISRTTVSRSMGIITIKYTERVQKILRYYPAKAPCVSFDNGSYCIGIDSREYNLEELKKIFDWVAKMERDGEEEK